MGLFAGFRNEIGEVWKDVREILFLKVQLIKWEAIEWISLFFAHVYFLILFGLLLFILLLLVILSFGFYILEWTKSIGLSLSISSLLLMIILMIIWKFKHPIILRPSKRFFQKMFREFVNKRQ